MTEEIEEIEETEETPEESPDTFPREYVEKLRKESAEHRVKAKRADEFAHRLHIALVSATGRLEDPTDLAFDETHLNDSEALEKAITELLEKKPHLAARRITGNVGQGETGMQGVDLAGILRRLA